MGGKKPILNGNILYSMNLNEHCGYCKEDAKTFMFHYGNFLLTFDCPVPLWGMFLLGLNPKALNKPQRPSSR